MCFDGVKRLCHIRGKLRKKVWINQSDIVLIGLRDYQDAKADVILKYSADEARNLKSYGEFPESVKINETVEFGGEGDDDIEFDDVDSDGSGDASGDDIWNLIHPVKMRSIWFGWLPRLANVQSNAGQYLFIFNLVMSLERFPNYEHIDWK